MAPSEADRSKPNCTYLLNTAILTGFGDWRFTGPLSIERAKELLASGFVSAIGHDAAAKFLSQLLDVEVATNRIAVTLNPGDQAVVLRLLQRLPEGQSLSVEDMRGLPFELGLLTRLR